MGRDALREAPENATRGPLTVATELAVACGQISLAALTALFILAIATIWRGRR